MLSRELIEAIKERIELDHTKEEIVAELEGAGYDPDMIEEVYRVAKTELDHPTPEHSIPTAGTAESMAVPQASTVFAGYGELMRAAKDLAIEQRDTFAKAVGLVFVAYAIFGAVVAVVAIDLLSSMSTIAVDPTSLADLDVSPTALLLLVPLTIGLIVFTMNVRLALLRNLFVREQGESFRGSLAWGWRHLIAFIIISFFISMTVQFGYLLLFIPGIALSLYLSFSSYVLVDEDVRGLRALTRSTELVYGRWWGILGRYLVVGLVVFGVFIAFGLILGILTFVLGIIMGGAADFLSLVFIPALIVIGTLVFMVLATWYTLCFRIVLFESLKASAAPQPLAVDTPRQLRILFIVFTIGGVCLTVFNAAQEDEPDPRAEFTASLEVMELRQDLLDAKSQTELFVGQNQLLRHSGLCNEILPMVSEEYDPRCLDGADGYALYAEAGGQMWCFDSSGFFKEIQVRPTGPSCLNAPPSPVAEPSAPTTDEIELPERGELALASLAEGNVERALLFIRIDAEDAAAELTSVRLSEFTADVDAGTLTITGEADDRSALAAFRAELASLLAVQSVDLPVSDLATATDVPFTLVVTLREVDADGPY